MSLFVQLGFDLLDLPPQRVLQSAVVHECNGALTGRAFEEDFDCLFEGLILARIHAAMVELVRLLVLKSLPQPLPHLPLLGSDESVHLVPLSLPTIDKPPLLQIPHSNPRDQGSAE